MPDQPRYQRLRVTAIYEIEVELPSDGWWLANVDMAALRSDAMTKLNVDVIEP
jgi:hypothetical protein